MEAAIAFEEPAAEPREHLVGFAGEVTGRLPHVRQRGNALLYGTRTFMCGLACLAALLVPAGLALAAPAASRSASPSRAFESALLTAINDTRQAHGLRMLRPATALEAAAARHSLEMGTLGYFSHASADGSSFASRFRGTWASAGENLLLASPNTSAAEMVSLWMRSPEHRANLLDSSWRCIGIAAETFSRAPRLYSGGPVEIVTADFGVLSAG